MNAAVDFQSALAQSMIDFVAFKRMQGYDYRKQERRLLQFDRFLCSQGFTGGVLDSDTIEHYVADTSHLAPQTRVNQVGPVRQFSRYLHALRPESVLVPQRILPLLTPKVQFFQLRPEQVQGLMEAATTLGPKNGIRPHCICFLIGLLYSTGLRVGEALSLDLRDVDTNHSTLFVRKGKFSKDRLVPMSSSTLEALQAWLELRSHFAGIEASAPLLVGRWNRRLSYDQSFSAFRTVCRRCAIHGEPPPRLHDLRHNYACRCITLWNEADEDVDALLPVLANAMGHVNVFSTQTYIHMNAGALQPASVKFNNHVAYHQATTK